VKDERENIIEKSQYDGRTGYRVFGEQFITPLPINLITKHINQQIERYRLAVKGNYMILNKFALGTYEGHHATGVGGKPGTLASHMVGLFIEDLYKPSMETAPFTDGAFNDMEISINDNVYHCFSFIPDYKAVDELLSMSSDEEHLKQPLNAAVEQCVRMILDDADRFQSKHEAHLRATK
jgi:hypothetical protein